jgi:hypothetical protein
MIRYALLGEYNQGDRENAEVIAFSDSIKELKKIDKAIDKIDNLLKDKDRYEPDDEVCAIMNKELAEVDIYDDEGDFVYEIETYGIYEIKKVA